MLVIMFDPRFINMKVIRDYAGNMDTINVVSKCDLKIVYPLLLQVYLHHLNPMKATIDPTILEDDDCFFGYIVLIDDAIMSTLKNELQILQ